MKEVIFTCTTCQYINAMDAGIKEFIEKQTKFDSLTDAYNHIIENEYKHNIIAEVKENDNT